MAKAKREAAVPAVPEAAPPMGLWVIRINGWHPARKNQLKAGRHWSVGAKLKAADRAMVAAHCRLAGVPEATGKRRVTLLVELAKGQRGGDVDAYWLSLLDALKKCGAIKNDSREWVEIAPVEYRRAPGAKGCVITLEDIGS
jgi:hypothetical protein